MGIEVGPVAQEQVRDFIAVQSHAFGFDATDEQMERFQRVFEFDRARAAYDGTRMVGTVGSFSLEMTVPGNTMRCGGTTVVAVLPSHRRRGILRQMIDSHLDDVRDHEEPIAGLWASDSAIYGRFGYGCAALGADITIERDHVEFHRLAPAQAPVRLVDADEAHRILPPFYDTARLDYPGFLARSEVWWQSRRFRDDPSSRDGATAYRYAVAEENGAVTGFVQYRFHTKWADGHGKGTVKISELVGTTPESWAGLWSYILNHDLTSKIEAEVRPLSDPVFNLMAGIRRARGEVGDTLWIRIMDVPRALEGRHYSTAATPVIRVHDPLDASTTTWQIDLAPDGAQVTPSQAEAQVEMDIEDLSACFMGWSRFQDLARTGRVQGNTQALRSLDAAFAWSPLPWCPEVF